jgi:hypothetical protein
MLLVSGDQVRCFCFQRKRKELVVIRSEQTVTFRVGSTKAESARKFCRNPTQRLLQSRGFLLQALL